MLQRLRNYFRLGVIVGPLPNNIIDGTIIDAVPVMANYNWIIAQVNANVPPLIPTVTALAAFTPVANFGGGSVGITYSKQVGAYVKVGSMVFFSFDIIFSSKGSSTGNFNVGGLPYTINAAWPGNGSAAMSVFTANVTFTNGIMAYLEPGTTQCTAVNLVSAGSPLIITDAGCTNTSEFACSGFYST